MSWIRDVIVDILVTLFIGSAVWLGDPWMWWVIAVYTALLVIAKSVVLTGEGFLRRAQRNQRAPEWFLHLLYGLNCVLLAWAGWWLLMGGWLLIWLLSIISQRKMNNG